MMRELLVVFAVLMLGGAVLATWRGTQREERVAGARRHLRAGTQLTVGDLIAVQPSVTTELRLEVPLVRSSRLIGATLVRDVAEGQAITLDDVGAPPTSRSTAARPRPGLRRRARSLA